MSSEGKRIVLRSRTIVGYARHRSRNLLSPPKSPAGGFTRRGWWSGGSRRSGASSRGDLLVRKSRTVKPSRDQPMARRGEDHDGVVSFLSSSVVATASVQLVRARRIWHL